MPDDLTALNRCRLVTVSPGARIPSYSPRMKGPALLVLLLEIPGQRTLADVSPPPLSEVRRFILSSAKERQTLL